MKILIFLAFLFISCGFFLLLDKGFFALQGLSFLFRG